jgi:hypothetical protein
MYAATSESNITAYVKKFVRLFEDGLLRLISLQCRLYFADFFTWTALGGVDFAFLTHLGRKATIVEGGTASAATLCHQRNQ